MIPNRRSLTPGSMPAIHQMTGDILIVDDSAANLMAIEAALGDFGVHIVRAQSGTEALRIALEHDFALILLDVKMPSMNGFETAQLIRKRKRSMHTPIIFVTAFSRDDTEVSAAYALGAVDFLFKPIIPEVLRAKVGVFVELHRRAGEVARQAELLGLHALREHERAVEEERRRWESEALRSRMEQLALADRHKDEFLAMLGHELRNPVVPIVAGLELLKDTLSNSTVAPEALRVCIMMERHAQHLVRLMDDLLDISRITAGKIELRNTQVTLQEVVEQAVTTSQPLIDQRRHTLSLQMPAEPLVVDGDVVRLVQVLSNLLNNAARYTPSQGTIAIRCAKKDGNLAEIRVTDDGQGIAPELLSRIFDLFVQERNATGGGLGLGLSLAKRLITMHHGKLTATSDGPGKGSTFTVELPLVESSRVVDLPESSAAPSPQSAKPMRIVLIEDNDDIREMMQTLLVKWGHEVRVAADGETGAALIVDQMPDVAFVDLGLPVLDGYAVAKRVRERIGAGTHNLRLVAMTGFGNDSAREKCRGAGFDTHLVKPADMKTLRKILSREET